MFPKLLIANRGEIALRIIRTCQRLGIATVAVYSDADRTALHVRAADEAVRIGSAAPAQSYLSIPALIQAARDSGAAAIHPGYGFLSEDPAFAAACVQAGIVFIGPSPAALRLVGDKTAARRLARDHDLPILPGLPAADDDATLLAGVSSLGFPVMIKAAAGGGGRGMRVVDHPDALPDALATARREAQTAFGDGALFLERAVVGGRHVEVQIIADTHGSALHLGERDCSIQRRHQKVIEESPAPGLPPELRSSMTAAALRLARAAGYTNAGTAEFLLDAAGHFYFLEVNARLQVEHGVTELVTGLDLVELQLRVAAGRPLGLVQNEIAFAGHAIECRLYAEDPARGYLPSPGYLSAFEPPVGDGIRNDVGFQAGSNVPAAYDPLLAKLLVHAPARDAALDRCRRALDAYVIEGVTTNLQQLTAVLGHPDFRAGAATLQTLEALPPDDLLPRLPDDALIAAAAADLRPPNAAADPWRAVGAWRSTGCQTLRYAHRGVATEATVERLPGHAHTWRLIRSDGSSPPLQFGATRTAGGTLLLDIGDTQQRWSARRSGCLLSLESPDGRRYALAPPRPSAAAATTAAVPGEIRAPMNGEIVSVLVQQGDRVHAGQPLLVMEAMKMEHTITAAAHGVVETVACAPGANVAADELLIELDLGGEEP